MLPKYFAFAQAVAGLGNPVDLLSMRIFMDDYFPARNKFEKQINDWAQWHTLVISVTQKTKVGL